MREEHDMPGALPLPNDCPWGVHAERARRLVSVSGRRVPESLLLLAMNDMKRACARANISQGGLPAETGEAIEAACDELMRTDTAECCPLDVLQGEVAPEIVERALTTQSVMSLGHRRRGR